MSLPTTSIVSILDYLDPYLDTLQTGFPTSTRPNEPTLTKDQKRSKIQSTLSTNPAIFLTKWGSVLLYPRLSATQSDVSKALEDKELTTADCAHAKAILDLFAPLEGNYEVKYQLTRLYQQLQQITEHNQFEASRQGVSNGMDMDLETDQPTGNKDMQEKELKPEPGQNDLFNRSTLSQNTRRNRRLNYLLRHLAPPDPTQPSISPAGHFASTSSTARSTGGSGKGGHHEPSHPTLANILSISGSMSNLSFSESTYFSDAEMEARAPDLYQQYIGRFMDHDDDEDDRREDDENMDKDGKRRGGDDGEEDEDADADDEREDEQPHRFGNDVGLVDRILWNIDHPTKRQIKLQRQEEMDRKNRYQEDGGAQSQLQPASSSEARLAPDLAQRLVLQRGRREAKEEEEMEEEFDTESEVEGDADLAAGTKNPEQEDPSRKGPLADVPDDELVVKTSVTPRIPPDPIPGLLSSTMASAAMTLDPPEERSKFAEVENGNDIVEEGEGDSENERTLDERTERRKEDQDGLRKEFVLLMKQRFLDGLDTNFDYSVVDFDEELDDLEQENHDEEDRWFDAEDEDEGDGDEDLDGLEMDENKEQDQTRHQRARREAAAAGVTSRAALSARLGLNYDQRLAAWESRAQNGSGDYDY